jgi:hypothetical protein
VSIPINLDQKLELRDESGAIVGFVLPEKLLHSLLTEREALRKQVTELEEELATLRKEATQVKGERDGYLESLHYLTRNEIVPLTEEELAELRTSGIPLQQLLSEVEETVGLKASGE